MDVAALVENGSPRLRELGLWGNGVTDKGEVKHALRVKPACTVIA